MKKTQQENKRTNIYEKKKKTLRRERRMFELRTLAVEIDVMATAPLPMVAKANSNNNNNNNNSFDLSVHIYR